MKIVFEDSALEELYVGGTTTNSQYRKLAKDVVKQYVKVVLHKGCPSHRRPGACSKGFGEYVPN